MHRLLSHSLILIGSALGAAGGQCVDSATARRTTVAAVGSVADEWRRMAQDVGRCANAGTLIRSAASLTSPLPSGPNGRWSLVAPTLDATFNSTIPRSLNDGPQWSGRGLSTTLMTGVRGEIGALSISVSPELVFQQNRPFSFIPSSDSTRSPFASPWHSGIESADLPLRFGDGSTFTLYPGESWIELRGGSIAGGWSSEGLWWGPGVRNGIVMSNNAPGIPQLYLRSAEPLETPLGDVEFRVLLGALTESSLFDTVSTNNLRALSAGVATLRVAFDSGLTVGIARSVYAPVTSLGAIASHVGDVATRWNQRADTAGPAPRHPSDQLISFFGRWLVPSHGFEVYAEWAKLFAPGLREMLVAPQRHQGFTVGLQWANQFAPARTFRFQAEATTLEQTPPASRVVAPLFYTSRFVRQGYTQRGQVIGASIGPGASSQWIAGDYFRGTWRVGAFIGRMRIEDDVMYLQPTATLTHHDVDLFSGIRGGARRSWADVSGELTVGRRLNYLFQSDSYNPGDVPPFNAIDVQNVTLRVRVSP